MDSSSVQVTRWKRYGKDRLYVARADKSQIGFWDLIAEEAHPVTPEDLTTVVAAVQDWKAALGDSSTKHVPRPSIGTASVAAETSVSASAAKSDGSDTISIEPEATPRSWLDLATNEPGAGLREQAVSARGAAPVKTLLARVLRVHTDERAWRIGADGEELVATQLNKAAEQDPRWKFIHTIPVGNRGSDIDHVITGPGGIFTVNTKHHPKAKIWVGGNTFMVDGHKTTYIRNSRHEATRAARLLTAACGFPVHVEGLIVTVNASDVVIKSAPVDVHVTWRKDVASWLLRRGDILGTDTVEAVYDAARRSTTWK